MLSSLIATLKLFGITVTKTDILNISIERGENPDDFFYLCETDDADYLIFETDYVSSLEMSIAEGLNLFEIRADEVVGYTVKDIDQATGYGLSKYPSTLQSRDKLAIDGPDDLKFAVLKIKVPKHTHHH